MKGILLLTGILFICTTCFEMPESPIKKKDKRNAIEKYWDSGGISACLTTVSNEKRDEIVDNQNGAISLVTNNYTKYDACPWQWGQPAQKNGTGVIKFTGKKCLQGQVYRQAQNDCKGAGTAANYWNAQKYQLCPTNVSTCGNLSPVKISCQYDTTVSFYYFISTYKEIKSHFKSRTDEIPSNATDYYWDSGSNIAFNLEGQIANPTPNYDSFQYVLCF